MPRDDAQVPHRRHSYHPSSSHRRRSQIEPKSSQLEPDEAVQHPDFVQLRTMRAEYFSKTPEQRRKEHAKATEMDKPDESSASLRSHRHHRRHHGSGSHRKHSHASSMKHRAGDQDSDGYTYVYDSKPLEREPKSTTSYKQRDNNRVPPRPEVQRERSAASVRPTAERKTSDRHQRQSRPDLPPRDASKRESAPPRDLPSTPSRDAFARPALKRSSTTSRLPPREPARTWKAEGDGLKVPEVMHGRAKRDKASVPGLLWALFTSSDAPPSKSDNPTVRHLVKDGTCAVCQEDCRYSKVVTQRSKALRLRCGCVWCKDCLRDIFQRSTQDRSLMPPKCCPSYGDISLGKSRIILSQTDDERLWRLWMRRYEEWKTDKGLNCPVRGCGAYISQARIESRGSSSRRLECHKCQSNICLKCRNLYHGSRGCPTPQDDPDEYAFDALAASNKWQTCPNCKIKVSKEEGCNHMTCMCGFDFCWLCQKPWHQYGCECPFFGADDPIPMMDADDVRRVAGDFELRDLEQLLETFRRTFLQD